MTARLDTLGRRIPDRTPDPYEHATRHNTGPRQWVEQAACRNHPNPELWFPKVAQSRGRLTIAATNPAKAICRRCPVIEQCLSHAMRANEAGIWGGLTEGERQTLRQKGPK